MSHSKTYKCRADRVVCEVPVELIFTEGATHAPVENATEAWRTHRDRFADVALARDVPHLSLYRHLLTDATPSPYLEWHERLFTTRGFEPPMRGTQMLIARAEQLKQMRDLLAKDQRAPVQLAPEVEWNSKGYFNLRDGHHRAAMFFCLGWRRIVVEMSIDDHERWLNRLDSFHVRRELDRQGRVSVYSPIVHPQFYDVRAHRDVSAPSRLDLALGFFAGHRFTGKSVLDIGANTGFYSQHFAREGLKVTSVEYDEAHVRLARSLNRLFRLDIDVRHEGFLESAVEPHDIGVLLTVLYHQLRDPDVGLAFLKAVDAKVRDLLIWESGEAPERETELIQTHTRFTQYARLATTYGTGRKRELGVFMTPSIAESLLSFAG